MFFYSFLACSTTPKTIMDHKRVHITHIFILKGDFTQKFGKISDFQKIDVSYKKSIIEQNFNIWVGFCTSPLNQHEKNSHAANRSTFNILIFLAKKVENIMFLTASEGNPFTHDMVRESFITPEKE